jgi:hypothetical protein
MREELVKLVRAETALRIPSIACAVEQARAPGECAADLPIVSGGTLMVRRLRRKRLVRPANPGRLIRSNQEWAVDFTL